MTNPTEVAMAEVLAEVLTELAAVRAELAELRSRTSGGPDAPPIAEPSSDESTTVPEIAVTSRRRLFTLAGGAAAAAVVTGMAGSARPAAASNGDLIPLAQTIAASSGAAQQTLLDYSPTTAAGAANLFLVSDGLAGSSYPAAVAGYAYNRVTHGVYGFSVRPLGAGVVGVASSAAPSTTYGVWGVATTGVGVVGESATGYDFAARGSGRVHLDQFKAVGPPSVPADGSFLRGEIVRDGAGDFFVCVDDGSPGTWRSLGGKTSAGSLHLLDNPTRVYDSRLPAPGVKLGGGAIRVVKVSDAINLTTGAVATADIVPVGATAVLFNLTLDGATANGFMAITPGNAPDYKASTINWTPTTSVLANGATVKVDATRSIKAWTGGAGTTHFVIDISGYYI